MAHPAVALAVLLLASSLSLRGVDAFRCADRLRTAMSACRDEMTNFFSKPIEMITKVRLSGYCCSEAGTILTRTFMLECGCDAEVTWILRQTGYPNDGRVDYFVKQADMSYKMGRDCAIVQAFKSSPVPFPICPGAPTKPPCTTTNCNIKTVLRDGLSTLDYETQLEAAQLNPKLGICLSDGAECNKGEANNFTGVVMLDDDAGFTTCVPQGP